MAIVIALAVTETTSFGVLYYGFGTFLPSMERSLGWSKLALTGAFSIALLVAGVAGVAVGHHLDHHRPQVVMTIGSVVAAAGTLGWSYAESPVAFYAIWVLIGLAMSAVLYEPAFIVLARRFEGDDRRKALTAVTLLAGLASTIFVPLEEKLIRELGWRPALRVLALVLFAVTVPLHAFVLRDRPKPADRVGPETANHAGTAEPASLTIHHAVRDQRFWYLLGAGVLLAMTVATLTAHQLAFLQERGWSARSAAAAIGAIGLWQVGGRLVFAPIGRWVSSRTVTVGVYLCQVVALGVLAWSSGPVAIFVYVAGTGLSRGMYTLVRATLVVTRPRAYRHGRTTRSCAPIIVTQLAPNERLCS